MHLLHKLILRTIHRMGNYLSRNFTRHRLIPQNDSMDNYSWFSKNEKSLPVNCFYEYIFLRLMVDFSPLLSLRVILFLLFTANVTPLKTSRCSGHLFNFACQLFTCLFSIVIDRWLIPKHFKCIIMVILETKWLFWKQKELWTGITRIILAFTIQEVYSTISFIVSITLPQWLRFSPAFYLL